MQKKIWKSQSQNVTIQRKLKNRRKEEKKA
jgi:hypothetical protein